MHRDLPRSNKDAKAVGSKYFFTGRVCKNGHLSRRMTSSGGCMDCSKEAMRRKRACVDTRKKMQAQWRDWYHSGNQKKRVDNSTKWRSENADKVRVSARASVRKFRSTPEGKAYSFAVKCLSRCLSNKTDRTFNLLGYTRTDLINRIESKFKPGMSWENYGDWHIDHIKAVTTFLHEGETKPSVINALNNLQPLWASENISKGNK